MPQEAAAATEKRTLSVQQGSHLTTSRDEENGVHEPLITTGGTGTHLDQVDPKDCSTMQVGGRFKAPPLLLFGALCTVLGFIFVSGIGLLKFWYCQENRALHLNFASGLGYMPSTVSEMVYDRNSAGGRIFFTLGLIAGGCLFTSWYPYHLRNVYTGDACIHIWCGKWMRPFGISIYWTTLRQIMPPMGLWLLIGVNTYPVPIAQASIGHTKLACMFLHLSGASMLFMGYLLCELKAIGWLSFLFGGLSNSLAVSNNDASREVDGVGIEPDLEPKEKKVRGGLAVTVLICFVAFGASQIALNILKITHVCCNDKWAMTGSDIMLERLDSGTLLNSSANVSGMLDEGEHVGLTHWDVSVTVKSHHGQSGDHNMSKHWSMWMHGSPHFGEYREDDSTGAKHMRVEQEPELLDTASGAFFVVKVVSVLCEDVAGVALVLSHIAVWYFCEERHVPYGKYRLAKVHGRAGAANGSH
jgi:hypothetical protein